MNKDKMFKNKRVIVFGSNGTIGYWVKQLLENEGALVLAPTSSEVNLLYSDKVDDFFRDAQAEYCLNLSGWNGGIAMNLKLPASINYRTTIMGYNCLQSCASYKVKVLQALTSCSYPDMGNESLSEEDFQKCEPHPTVACHAYAKRSLYNFSLMLEKQYGLQVRNVVFNNVYGPPRKDYDPMKTKLGDALIVKAILAKRNNTDLVVWGTGNQRRELLFSRDAAKACLEVMEHYHNSSLINIGSGVDVSVKELVERIVKILDFRGAITYDTSKPDGVGRKLLNITKMQQYLDFYPETSLDSGIRETIQYYETNF